MMMPASVWRRQGLEHLPRRLGGRGAPSKRMPRTTGRHCSRTKYSWNAERARVGLHHRAHRGRRVMGRMRAAIAQRRRQMRADAGQRLAGARRCVRSTCVARSPSPSLNQVGPPSSPSARMKVHVSSRRPHPVSVVDQARQGVEHGVDVGRDVQAQMLEVVAGVDDDGEPLAQQLRQPERRAWRRRRRRRAQRSAARSQRGSSEQVLGLGPDQRRRRARPGASSRARAPAPRVAPRRPRPWPARPWPPPHRQSRPRSPPAGGPLRSFSPRRSQSEGTPAAPMASPTVPSRQARPTLSETMTPMSAWKCASSRSLRRWRAGVGLLAAAAARAGRGRRRRGSTDRCRRWP